MTESQAPTLLNHPMSQVVAATDPTRAKLPQYTKQATEIVAKLSESDKIRLLSGKGFWILESLPEYGIDGILMTDGPHGLRQQGDASDHMGIAASVPSTCFPPAVTLGSSWDEALVYSVGEAIGREARDQGVAVVLGPGLNIKRHPAGGRNFEYYSEDPLLSGKLASAWISGLQSQSVGASAKHYAVNNQEAFRLVVDAVVDERTLREIYLTGFEILITESQPWTVMCSYNLINGTYGSEHKELLTNILRDEWGFEGLVVSDWGAVNHRPLGIAAGLDLEMPGSKGACDPEVAAALRDGTLSGDELDLAVQRVIELQLRGQHVGKERISADRHVHHQLTRKAAAAGAVLLENNGVLPLAESAKIGLIGAFATTPRYQGAGSSQVNPFQLDTTLEAMRERVGSTGSVTYAPGYVVNTGETNDALIEEALEVAHNSDVVVVCAGLPAPLESEGFDRDTLDLPAGHIRLIEALAATSTPVVVALNNGAVVHLPFVDRVAAVCEFWLGGQAGGSAMVDVLFGDEEPGGRLAESIPFHVAQLAADRNFPGLPRQVQYREGLYIGYRYHDTANVPAQYPFGFGRSYTEFEWSDPQVSGSNTDLTVTVTVTNTGQRAGSDVVQVYVRDPECSVHRPEKELRGFAKVHLDPGASEDVTIQLNRRSFALWDVGQKNWVVEAGAYEILVGASSVDIKSHVTVNIESDDVVTPVDAPSNLVADQDEFIALLGHDLPDIPAGRPFHRNSTLGEIEQTKIGKLLVKEVMRQALKRSQEEFPNPDEATVKMIQSAMREGPVRSLALMSGGVVSMQALDSTIDALNGEIKEAITGLLKTKDDS